VKAKPVTVTKARKGSSRVVTVAPPPMLHRGWIDYRLLSGDTNQALRVLLTNDDLPVPTDEILNTVRTLLAAPKGFDPTSKPNKTNVPFVYRLDCRPLILEPQARDKALEILRTPRVRELVEAGLLLGVPLSAIITTLAAHLKMTNVTEAAVQMFRVAFFDTDVVTRAQLKVAVQQRARQAVLRVVGGEEDSPAARRAISADARMVAVSLPSSPIAWNAVLMSMGYTPGKHELPKILDHLEQLAATRAAQALLRAGRDDERRSEAFVRVLSNLRQIHAGATSPEQEMAAKILQFKMKTERESLMTVADLRARGEDVTVDVVPAIDPRADVSQPLGDDGENFDAAVGDA
jgi:hypothetical protein